MSQGLRCLRHPSGSLNAAVFQLGRRHRAIVRHLGLHIGRGHLQKRNAHLLLRFSAHLCRNVKSVSYRWFPSEIQLLSFNFSQCRAKKNHTTLPFSSEERV